MTPLLAPGSPASAPLVNHATARSHSLRSLSTIPNADIAYACPCPAACSRSAMPSFVQGRGNRNIICFCQQATASTRLGMVSEWKTVWCTVPTKGLHSFTSELNLSHFGHTTPYPPV